MSRRKGEVTPAYVNRHYPHQVAIVAELATYRERGAQVTAFTRPLSLAPRNHFVMADDVHYSVYCFADRAHATLFLKEFGGEMVDPAELGRGTNWSLWRRSEPLVCNLYNVTTNQEAIRQMTRAMKDSVGNLEPSLDVYPDRMAPIVRNTPDGRELAQVRWGLPSSQKALLDAATKRADKLRAKGKPVDFNELLKMEPDGGTTNVRRTESRHWQRWLGIEHRCVVPVTRFAEPDPASKVEGGRTPNAWFARNADQPLMFFAGISVPQWESVRKVKDGLTVDDLFAFLTCEPNGVVGPVHQKAMPVLLMYPDEIEIWLTADWSVAKKLQGPVSDESMIRLPV